MAVEEGEQFYQVGIGRRGLLTKMETTLKSNYVFSNDAVKF
jgi:hypothetical protein